MLVKTGLLNNCVLDSWDISHPKGGEKKKKKKKEKLQFTSMVWHYYNNKIGKITICYILFPD